LLHLNLQDEQLQQLHEELNRTAFQLLAVNQAMKMLGSVTQLQTTLDLTVDMFVEMTRALYGCVILPHRGTAFVIRTAKGDQSEDLIEQRFSLPQSTLRWFKTRRTPAVLGEGSNDIPDKVRAALGQAPRPFALWVPLVVSDRLVGFVALSEKFRSLPYTSDELEVLATLASQTAIAIENAKLVQRLKGKVQLANQELRQANRSLSIEMAKLRATVEGMADGLFVTDPKGRLSFLNPAVRDFLGWGERKVEGEKIDQCAPVETLATLVKEATSGEETHTEREIVISEPLRRVYTARATALRDDKDKLQGAVTVLSDITALKELADMKADFVSFIVHELRTPLTSIKGFVLMLNDAPPDSFDAETVAEFYDIMACECERLLRMINELLDVSRLEAGRPLPVSLGPVNLVEVVAGLIKMQEHYSSGRHQLVSEIPENLSPVHADKDRVIQILTNLLSNAIKYSPDGGAVTTRLVEGERETTISVTDQGLGMKPEDKERLFGRYHRVLTEDTARIRGTGLGLFLTKELVELQSGRIWAESEYGKGSTFFFTLPRQPTA